MTTISSNLSSLDKTLKNLFASIEEKKDMMDQDLVVIMVPGATGHVHENLKRDLTESFEVVDMSAHAVEDMDDCLIEEVEKACRAGKSVVLHGWNSGAKIVMEYLTSTTDHLSSIVAVLLYAPAECTLMGKALQTGSPRTILYHNTNDTMVDIQRSVESVVRLGGRTILHPSQEDCGGNNHQCDEFVDATVKDLRICHLEHELLLLKTMVKKSSLKKRTTTTPMKKMVTIMTGPFSERGTMEPKTPSAKRTMEPKTPSAKRTMEPSDKRMEPKTPPSYKRMEPKTPSYKRMEPKTPSYKRIMFDQQ
jgi:hypothetical protein